MLLQELGKVKDLDDQIASLHANLVGLYQKRAHLVGASLNVPALEKTVVTAEPAASVAKPKAAQTRPIYNELAVAWQQQGLNIPAFASLRAKLKKAEGLAVSLQQADNSLQDKLSYLLVPPTRELLKLVEHSAEGGLLDQASWELFMAAKPASTWSILIVFDAESRHLIDSLTSYLESKAYLYEGRDCRGLGIHEIVAAQLQGLHLLDSHSWTVLCRDDGLGQVVCASLRGQAILLDIEDTDCLVGLNYLCPAIRIT